MIETKKYCDLCKKEILFKYGSMELRFYPAFGDIPHDNIMIHTDRNENTKDLCQECWKKLMETCDILQNKEKEV